MPTIRRHYRDVKKVLRKQDLADFFTGSKYGFSPYRACEHGCRYCDGRAEKYYVDGEFDKDIVVRRNLPEILDKELSKIRERGFLCIGSGVSDPYQPAERDELIMQRCAQMLAERTLPVAVMTKSSLVLRDLEWWTQVNRQKRFLLMVSLAVADDAIRERFEPHASPVEERLETLRRFKEAGCRIGVLAMPLLPGITDTSEHTQALADHIKDLKPDYVMPGGLTLRPGVQKETFMETICTHYPDLEQKYKEIYAENRQSGSPSFGYRQKCYAVYRTMQERLGVPTEIPHGLYRDFVTLYDEIYILLSQMAILYEYRGTDTRRLHNAIRSYREWIVQLRRPFNRSRSKSYGELEEMVRAACRSGEIERVLANDKLAAFVADVSLNRTVFDHTTMKLG